ncbi:hypothetical protein BDV98DRAFT_548322 [Pterulicium gracile]|uniref:Uncharacterized protein n=1 Tax=Pterulicium gracile TaxID=1884261 RepID=A0A5C3QKK2_9AGAR|nr:hypothetical protein BDV98DRAFT_548322 [Pterula gracilis]
MSSSDSNHMSYAEAAKSTPSQSAPAEASEASVLSRVWSIPLVSSSISAINDTLNSNPYTRSPYAAAVGISSSAYNLTKPIQQRLPLQTLDGYANKVMDAVESRYPYPFHAKPEEITNYLQQQKQNTNKTLDEKVRSPAYQMAQGIDQRFTPIVDYFQLAVDHTNNGTNGTDGHANDAESKYQYQRALALSHRLKDNIYGYSNEQLKQIQTQNALVQRATDTAQHIQELASSTFTQAQSRVHGLSENMLSTLQNLQTSTSASASHLRNELSSPQLQKNYQEISAGLSTTITHLRDIVSKKDVTVQEKVTLMANEVAERVSPLLARVREAIAGQPKDTIPVQKTKRTRQAQGKKQA